MVQFMVGVGWGWIAPTLMKLQGVDSDFQISSDHASWLGSISEAGRIFGPFVSPLLLDNIGRKYTLMLCTFSHFTVWFAVIFCQNIYILLAVRVLFGIANGMSDVLSVVYTTENCSPNFRGIIGGVVQLTFFAALFMEFIITTYFSYTHAAIANTVLSILASFSLFYATETPYFLTMKGKHEKAKKNFVWLRAGVEETNVNVELEKIRKNVEEEKEKKESVRVLLTNRENLKGIIAVVGFFILGGSTGFHALLPYASMMFSPSETFTQNEYTIIFGVVQFIAVFISPFIVEKIDRRTFAISSFAWVAICNISTWVLLFLHNRSHDIILYPWLLFLSITTLGACHSLLATAGYTITGELLPLSVRAIGGSMAVTVQSLVSFLTAIFFWPITHHLGMETNFLIYAVFAILTTIFIYARVPETRGKSLHDMHAKKPKPVENP
jgi:MFS family permease